MNHIQKLKKEQVRTREMFMLSVVSFDQKSRVLKPHHKSKKREKTEKCIRMLPILPDEKLLTSFCDEDMYARRIERKYRGEVDSERKQGLKTLNEKISRRIAHQKNIPTGFQGVNTSSLIPSFRVNCISLRKFSENERPSKRIYNSMRTHQSQYSLRSKIDRLQKLTTDELENTVMKNGVDKRLINIGINIKAQGRIMIKRKISIAPWTSEEQFQKLL